MRRRKTLLAAATVTTVFTGAAMAGSLVGSPEHGAHSVTESPISIQQRSIKSVPKHTWERRPILDLVQNERVTREEAPTAASSTRWERGEILKDLKEKGTDTTDSRHAEASPRVKVYMDRTATEPGLPRTLGNTNAGRSIMLKYLEQARGNAPSS